MSHIKDRLSDYHDFMKKLVDDHQMVLASDVFEMIEQLQDDLEQDEKENRWIPVSERLPEERDSIFAKFKGTDNWKRGMFEKTSKYVIATVVFDDGTVLVQQAHTTDGIWRTDKKILGGTVVAWMDYPEPYKED
jgi:N-methylhydantoinase B/oxoprolinase/acetone carboxylase alpha subunit